VIFFESVGVDESIAWRLGGITAFLCLPPLLKEANGQQCERQVIEGFDDPLPHRHGLKRRSPASTLTYCQSRIAFTVM
jgi:hypothetical protein